MKTIKGIVYEGKAPFMTWDIEKDIENQIASTKAEFIEEYGEEIKKEIKKEIETEYLDKNKDKIKAEYLNQLSLETKEQNTIHFIKNMLKENIPLKSIAKISNKSIEEIKELSKNLTKDLS